MDNKYLKLLANFLRLFHFSFHLQKTLKSSGPNLQRNSGETAEIRFHFGFGLVPIWFQFGAMELRDESNFPSGLQARVQSMLSRRSVSVLCALPLNRARFESTNPLGSSGDVGSNGNPELCPIFGLRTESPDE